MADCPLYVEDDDDSDYPYPRIRDAEGYSYIYFDPAVLSPDRVQEIAEAAYDAHTSYDDVWGEINDALVDAGAWLGDH